MFYHIWKQGNGIGPGTWKKTETKLTVSQNWVVVLSKNAVTWVTVFLLSIPCIFKAGRFTDISIYRLSNHLESSSWCQNIHIKGQGFQWGHYKVPHDLNDGHFGKWPPMTTQKEGFFNISAFSSLGIVILVSKHTHFGSRITIGPSQSSLWPQWRPFSKMADPTRRICQYHGLQLT
jgi:hypothetical protein